jgi:hypothetical protein
MSTVGMYNRTHLIIQKLMLIVNQEKSRIATEVLLSILEIHCPGELPRFDGNHIPTSVYCKYSLLLVLSNHFTEATASRSSTVTGW